MLFDVVFDNALANQIIRYARFCANRNYVSNQLGNIAVRVPHPSDDRFGVIYTKRRGVSLEEMELSDVVITDVESGRLLHGDIPPSIGHVLNRTIFQERPDVHAVIHLHVDILIAYFSTRSELDAFRYLSIDSPLVMKRNPYVLEKHINVEADVGPLRDIIQDTDCFVMPNHGVTALGKNLSEAYHRLNTLVAEVWRIYYALQFSRDVDTNLLYLDTQEVEQLYRVADSIV